MKAGTGIVVGDRICRLIPADELDDEPTLSEGQADDCKVDEDDGIRYWLSRVGKADGVPWDRMVTIERRDHRGRWYDAVLYDGDNPEDRIVGESFDNPASYQ